MRFSSFIKLLFFFFLISCGSDSEEENQEKQKSDENTLYTLLDSEETGIAFINEVKNSPDFNIFKYRNFYNGGGVAIGDINNDGLPDIYLTANMKPNKLYLNKGNFKFEDISKSAGIEGNKPWSTGVNMVDINQDGLLDIYVSNAGNMEGDNHNNDLYINNGDLTFTEKAAEYNLAETGFSTHASFFDYDKDGDLDAYILNNSNIPVSSLGYAEQREVRAQDWEGVPKIFRGVGDMLLRNDNGKFVDVSEEANIYGSLIGFGLGVMVSDFNNDLYPDIYVSNDFYERDYLYINNQDGTFTEDIENWTSHLSLSAMGIDMADINNDGFADIFITDMLPDTEERVKSVMEFEGYNVFKLKQSKDFFQQYIQNTLQLHNGNNSFSEIANFSGVESTDWSWAGLIFDMDNDGNRDIYVTNGINHDLTDLDFVEFFANEIIQKMALTGKKEAIDSIIDKMPVTKLPNYAYKNTGNLKFKNSAEEWGLGIPSLSNGCAYGDLDNDGDLDLVVNNVNMESFVYRNNSDKLEDRNYLRVKLKGNKENSFGIGSILRLYYGNEIIMQEQNPSRGFQSSMDYTMNMGLGEVTKIDSLRIIWPNSKTQLMTDIKVNQTLILDQKEASEIFTPEKPVQQKKLLTELPNNNFESHQENNYTDFDFEGMIYKKLSQEGPALAVADVNGDGSEDVFIGGAREQEGFIYINNGDGNLKLSKQPALKNDLNFEDTSAAFFDADGDGDQDLMIGSGGNEIGEENNYRARLYINDGRGNFTRSTNTIPSINQNIAVIAPNDFDSDGDIDVFIGSRSVAVNYGLDPQHLFLENRGNGEFVNATERISYDVKYAGMITAAIWQDIDGDDIKDLITVSDWGAPKIFKNSGRRLSNYKTNLNEYTGWWNTVESADLDNDGDQDLILGNKGSNIPYETSFEAPMKMWVNDFDNNGTIEQVVTTHKDGKDYPLHMKRELTSQLVSLKKENLKASEYAKKSITELLSKEKLANALVKEAVISETILAVNEGNGKFRIKELPGRVQFSCICGISCIDVNQDGNLDLVMAGNNFEFKPQFSRLDASFGNVLLGDGKMNFEWQDYGVSGFNIKSEVKFLRKFQDKNGKTYIIAAINDEKPKIFEVSNL
ncbi:VCBS repeat-containing protein [Christiangramia sediminis]|uniref:VCBS repeat-containing protein n=1 Tax=Christiangramia sediminis TaxID=2881336 RepID=A0A9X1LGQ2_9FLAO|nr:VCBS repeat-containing protein [Christiangramia sediminis]MCB7479999.1 VCBS repeat-containing protein [Christiangramia sediminis]